MIKWSIFTIFIWIPFSAAFKAEHGHCPNITAVGDLDMDRFKGIWYTHSIYAPLSRKVPRCQSTEFIHYDEHFYKIQARELSSQTDTVKVREELITKIFPSEGRYIQATHNKALPEGAQIYVLETDYDNFAIRYMCFDAVKIFSYHWAVIQFRHRLPSSGIIYVAQELAKRSGITISDMSKVPQESCPRDS
ncbi:uncharacterized protein Dana_GF19686 [Drosophila ananassae]|uniref:Lipocalin/cytosolic fatty-acid binding domain-containing protein n=1 Tax=Drosophila ananassae TaxID=7217 RepID=B3MNC4_DROAN|nr:apolipoprotein D [Drosophila ananassae]EDV31081.2 uncharacterized protein Dana_GF19686 [Drosophila ananassae]